ncbi:beta-catenin-interacting protein 1 isoform X1 [Polyodon spathula]|uniref:beta-catenin-interacting protein 1 isoform X1 n=1 Tax=Polyodon spathula TaxID=7913 RepID=UPI001B7ECB09|nr:beta-catenin-interacting protein 1 isoform X1 [Polyodon spathula]
MNSDSAPGKTPEEMYIEQKVRVLLMLKKMGSNLTPSEEAFLRSYSGVVNSQLSQLPQHPIDQEQESCPLQCTVGMLHKHDCMYRAVLSHWVAEQNVRL